MGVTLKLEFSHFGKIGDELMGAVAKALDTTADAIVQEAEINTVRVDTGAMKNGWLIETTGPLERTIYNAMDYAKFNEFGTSRMSASPMLTPAVEHNRGAFVEAMKEVFGE